MPTDIYFSRLLCMTCWHSCSWRFVTFSVINHELLLLLLLLSTILHFPLLRYVVYLTRTTTPQPWREYTFVAINIKNKERETKTNDVKRTSNDRRTLQNTTKIQTTRRRARREGNWKNKNLSNMFVWATM